VPYVATAKQLVCGHTAGLFIHYFIETKLKKRTQMLHITNNVKEGVVKGRSVIVEDTSLYEDGFFGTGSLSRSRPSHETFGEFIIDEYDNAVNKALGDVKLAFSQHLYVKASEEGMEQLKNDIDVKNNLFWRFFFEIKSQIRNNTVGKVFITGVAPIALNDFTCG
jgi:hypothetical protein